jgi:hypothetical protein
MRIVNIMDVWEKRREHVEGQEGDERREKQERERRGGNGTGATGTVNVGTSAATVNIGTTAASTVNIGNANGIVNINKIRLSGNPVISYYFTTGQTQDIPAGVNTAVKYPTAETRNATGTGITYSSSTGVFTNSNSYSVVIVVSASVLYPTSPLGARTITIIHSTMSQMNICQVAGTAAAGVAVPISSTFILNANETFYVNAYQDSGGILTISPNTANRVSVLVL